MKLDGLVALVTGGAAGIGRAIVLELARQGASVAIVDQRDAGGVVREVEGLGRAALALQADVAAPEQAARAVTAALERFGRLDILVNNAGINQDSVVWKMTEQQWDAVLDVNLKGSFNFIHAAAPHFKDRGAGKIVNITSINGLRGKFGQANYAAAKAGLVGLTKSVARELGKFNVNVNAVAPGLIETDMTRALPAEARDKSLAEILLGRIGQPEDVARAVVFLCSEEARHITGAVLHVDGGQYL